MPGVLFTMRATIALHLSHLPPTSTFWPVCQNGLYYGSGLSHASMMQDSSCMQVSSTLISSDGHTDPEPLAINAVSAAVHTSDIPWKGMPSTAADKAHQGSNVHCWYGHVWPRLHVWRRDHMHVRLQGPLEQ